MTNKNYPPITILIVTYDRPKEIRRTIDALVKHLKYKGKLRWHIADDASPGTYVADIKQQYPKLQFTATRTERQGWGANVNKALQHIKDDYIFLCEDDYVAKKDVNLSRGVAVLRTVKDIGVVRYDGIAAHVGFILRLREVRTGPGEGRQDYLIIDKHSKHLNVYSNRPHLRHRRFHDKLGLYEEGLSLGATESGYAHKVKMDKDGLSVVVLSDGIDRAFDHIGHSRQRTKEDVHK